MLLKAASEIIVAEITEYWAPVTDLRNGNSVFSHQWCPYLSEAATGVGGVWHCESLKLEIFFFSLNPVLLNSKAGWNKHGISVRYTCINMQARLIFMGEKHEGQTPPWSRQSRGICYVLVTRINSFIWEEQP